MLNILILIGSISGVYFTLRSSYPPKNIYMLKTLMFFGVDVINCRDSLGKTSLMFASGNGHINMVSLLLKEGADINAVDVNGKTALMFASDKGHSNVVSFLLSRGAAINVSNNNGRTALMCASSNGNSNVISLLLKAKADINVASDKGWTALKHASFGGHSNVVSLLLAAGADTNPGNDGWTALRYALHMRHSNVVSLLLAAESDSNLINECRQTGSYWVSNDDCRQLIGAAQVAIKQILNKELSFDETSFLTNKNNAALVEQYIKDRSLFILKKILSGKKLTEQEKIFTKDSSYFESLKDKFYQVSHGVSMAASDSVSTKITQDVMSKIFQFIPIEEILEIGPNLIEYSNLKNKIEVLRINAITNQKNDIVSVESIEPQKQFISEFLVGALVGTLLVNPAIRCERDKINDVNNDKTLGEYYQESLTLDNLNGIIVAFVIPTVTQIAYAYIGIPYIDQSYQVTEIVKQITDSPFAQGVLQVSLIEGTMLAMDGVGVLGQMAYCTAYECE